MITKDIIVLLIIFLIYKVLEIVTTNNLFFQLNLLEIFNVHT